MNLTTLSICALGLFTAATFPMDAGSPESDPANTSDPEEPRGAPRAVVLGDYNADGLSDVYAVNPYGEDRLYRNAGDGSFVDVTTETGLAGLSGTRQVLFADYDGDGLSDLLVVSAGTTRLFRNIGESFVDDTVRSGLTSTGPALDAKWEDIEGDGVLDLVLRDREGVQLYRGLGDGTFERLDLSVPGMAPTRPAATTDEDGGAMEEPGTPGAPGAGAPGAPGRAPAGGLPGGRPAVNTGGGGSAAATVGITWSGTGAGPNIAAGSGLVCAGSVEDQANPGTGFCIPASTTASVGSLYPLSETFFIDDTSGRIGMGTIFPSTDLHVVGETTELGSLMVAPNTGGGQNSELWLAEDLYGVYRMGFRYDGGANTLDLVARSGATEMGPWMSVSRDTGSTNIASDLSAARVYAGTGAYNSHTVTVSPEDGVAPLRVLTNDGDVYTTRLKVEADGKVAIGSNNTPSGHLHVYGDTQSASVKISPIGNNLLSELWLTENTSATLGMGFVYDGTSGNQLHVMGSDGLTVNGPWMSIQRDSGRVGIQTTDPQASLGVKVISGASSIIRGFDETDTTVFRVTVTGRTVTTAVQITGGGDIVEGFDSSEGVLEPGTVVIIDPENPGRVKGSSAAYDRKVAGVISGAGGINHGLQMGQDGVMDGENLVAMMGRVYVKCTAENGAIQAGDLLTTAGTRGHAMRADDPDRSFGAVIGKAMTSLEDGTGLVLVLVNLQ